jgi:putative ABC transport system ATP-binding protein
MTKTILQAKGVDQVLGSGAGKVHALKGVDLSLQGGELTMLVGPSGSGKTTLLSVLGCMLTPTAGTVEVCGHLTEGADAERLAQLRRDHIGFIFQNYHLFQTLTAAENVQLALDVRGTRGRDARSKAFEALARVGLAQKILSYPNELSGGEQQRVAIARALVKEPDILFADEPTGNLDQDNTDQIAELLKDLNAKGLTIVMATHDLELAGKSTDRIVRMHYGRIVDGTPPRIDEGATT